MKGSLPVVFSHERHCFATLPTHWAEKIRSERGFDLEEMGAHCRVVLELTLEHNVKAYIGWSIIEANDFDAIELPLAFANAMGIDEAQMIEVEVLDSIKEASTVFVEPKNEDDSEVLEYNQAEIEEQLLNQVYVLKSKMTIPVWIHFSTKIELVVVKAEVGDEEVDEAVVLGRDSKIDVKPKDRKNYWTNIAEYMKRSKPHKMRLCEMDNQLLEIIEKNNNTKLQEPVASEIQRICDDSRNVFVSKEFMDTAGLTEGELLEISHTFYDIKRLQPQMQPGMDAMGGGNAGANPEQAEVQEVKVEKKAYCRVFSLNKSAISALQNLNTNFVYASRHIRMELCAQAHAVISVKLANSGQASVPHRVQIQQMDDHINSQRDQNPFTRETVVEAFREWIQFQNSNVVLTNSAVPVSQKFVVSLPVKNINSKFVVSINESILPSRFGQPPVDDVDAGVFNFRKSDPVHSRSNLYLLSLQNISTLIFDNLDGLLPVAEVNDPQLVYMDEKQFGVFPAQLKTASAGIRMQIAHPALKQQLKLNSRTTSTATLVCGSEGCGRTTFVQTLCKMANIYSLHVKCREMAGDRADSILIQLKQFAKNAIMNSPALLFLDDIDALFPLEQDEIVPDPNIRVLSSIFVDVLTQITSRKSNLVLVIATCKSHDNLHKIVQKSKVFQTRLHLPPPTRVERIKVLENQLAKIGVFETSEEVLRYVSFKTENYTPKDLKNLLERAINMCMLKNTQRRRNFLKKHFAQNKDKKIEIDSEDFDSAMFGFKPQSHEGVSLLSSTISWKDVGGLESVKRLLRETLEVPTKYSRLFENSPLKLRSGILLYGPPGCGKTLLASAVAKECELNFIAVKGPELLNKYIGASEQAVRDVFEKAEAAKPCIIFFDEFDAIAPKRGHDNTGVTDRVVNQLLCQLDGVEARNGVYVLAATSRPDLIDAALLRPGRLDKCLLCDFPDQSERESILRAVSRNMKLSGSVDWAQIAAISEGYSGADIQGLAYSAYLMAVHDKLDQIKAHSEGQIEQMKTSDDVNFTIVKGAENPATNTDIFHEKISQKVQNIVQNINEEVEKYYQQQHKEEVDSSVIVDLRHLQRALEESRPSLSATDRMFYRTIYAGFKSEGGHNMGTEEPILKQQTKKRVTLA